VRYVDRRTVQTVEDMDAYVEREYSLSDAIEAQPAPPCDDRGDGRTCEHKAMCGLNKLACKAFFAYTREPSGGMSFVGWPTMERKPSSKIYEKTHRDND
jgi:hypothetical protein